LTKSLSDRLLPPLKRVFEAASEHGASGWLTVLLIADHGFAMPKGEFRDALCLHSRWQAPILPQSCVCVVNFFLFSMLSAVLVAVSIDSPQ